MSSKLKFMLFSTKQNAEEVAHAAGYARGIVTGTKQKMHETAMEALAKLANILSDAEENGVESIHPSEMLDAFSPVFQGIKKMLDRISEAEVQEKIAETNLRLLEKRLEALEYAVSIGLDSPQVNEVFQLMAEPPRPDDKRSIANEERLVNFMRDDGEVPEHVMEYALEWLKEAKALRR